jgi:hypothetical protein
MAGYVPPGWPSGVHPPGSEDFERTAVAWLLDVVPADYRLYGVLRRYPLALAAMATHHANACVAGAREGYRTARTQLGDVLPPHGLDALLSAYRAEGRRLVGTAQAVNLVSRALRGEVFTPQLSEATAQTPPPGQEANSHQANGHQANRQLANGQLAGNQRASGQQAKGQQAKGQQAKGQQPSGKAPSSKPASAKTPTTKTASTKTPTSETAGGKQAGAKESGATETRGKEVRGRETSGKQASGKTAGREAAGAKEADGTETHRKAERVSASERPARQAS